MEKKYFTVGEKVTVFSGKQYVETVKPLLDKHGVAHELEDVGLAPAEKGWHDNLYKVVLK